MQSRKSNGIFILLLIVNDRLTMPRLIHFCSQISYSLYLYHGVIGYLILAVLYPLTGFTIALISTLFAITSVSYCSWRYVELPSQQVARRILQRFTSDLFFNCSIIKNDK